MPDTDTQGVALEKRLREGISASGDFGGVTADDVDAAEALMSSAADLIADLRAQVERLERENETYRTAFDGIEPAAQEGREAVAETWTEEQIARFGEALCAEDPGDPIKASGPKLEALARHVLDYVFRSPASAPAQPAAQVVVVKPLDLSNLLKHAFLSGFEVAGGAPGAAGKWWVDYDPEECPAYNRILSALASPTDADAAVERLDEERAQTWPVLKKAIWDVVTFEQLNDGHYVNAYDLTDKLHFAVEQALTAAKAGEVG